MISPDLDTYHTDPTTPVSWWAKLLPLTRFAFYGPVMEIVWRASRLAARGALDDQAWLRSSNEELRVAEALGMDVQVEGLEHLRGLDGSSRHGQCAGH